MAQLRDSSPNAIEDAVRPSTRSERRVTALEDAVRPSTRRVTAIDDAARRTTRLERKAYEATTIKGITLRLKSDCVVTRYEAVQALGSDADPPKDVHCAVLANLVVSDESRLVRHAAARTLGTLGVAVSPHTAVLARALRDSEMLVRRDAAKAMSSADAESLKPHIRDLFTALEDAFWPVRFWACKTLGVCGPVVAYVETSCPRKLAIMALRDPEDSVRDTAAKVLPYFGSTAVEHIQWLSEKLHSNQEDDYRSACRALASVLSAPEVEARYMVKEALRSVLQRAEDSAREHLKTRSGRGMLKDHDGAAPSARQAVTALEAALEDDDWQTRFRAVEELRAMVVC